MSFLTWFTSLRIELTTSYLNDAAIFLRSVFFHSTYVWAITSVVPSYKKHDAHLRRLFFFSVLGEDIESNLQILSTSSTINMPKDSIDMVTQQPGLGDGFTPYDPRDGKRKYRETNSSSSHLCGQNFCSDLFSCWCCLCCLNNNDSNDSGCCSCGECDGCDCGSCDCGSCDCSGC